MGKHVNAEGFCVYSGFWWTLALPHVILPVHLGVFAGTYVWALSRPHGTWITVGPGALLGLSIWTLFEYVLHRWLLHHTRHAVLRSIFWHGFHREHHMYPHMEDPDHHGIHLAISLPINLLLVGSVGLATESGLGLAAAAGWVLAYCVYEALHWLFHSGAPHRGPWKFRGIQHLGDAHTVHHLYRANKNYGFMTTIWDRCFGTYLPLAQALERRCKVVRQPMTVRKCVGNDTCAKATCSQR